MKPIIKGTVPLYNTPNLLKRYDKINNRFASAW